MVVTQHSGRLMYVYDVIASRGAPVYQCVWFEDGKLAESVFEADALRRASEVHTLAA